MQTTVQETIEIQGTGLHSGRPANLRLIPAPANHGIKFTRVDITDRDNIIPARYDAVNDTMLCTRISNEAGVEVSTIEHLMAALAGTGVHNLMVEIDGPEVPIMDGSSAEFVKRILNVGLTELDQNIRAIRVLKSVEVSFNDVSVRLDPSETLEIDFEIDFADPAIGTQQKTLNMANGAFVRELCDSRTFCAFSDVEKMQASGLALGGSLENALVIDQGSVMNPDGMRHNDECVRHKMLDALGDLYLAGAPILARYSGNRAGHRATNMLLRALFADPDAYEIVTCDAQAIQSLPGRDVELSDLTA